MADDDRTETDRRLGIPRLNSPMWKGKTEKERRQERARYRRSRVHEVSAAKAYAKRRGAAKA